MPSSSLNLYVKQFQKGTKDFIKYLCKRSSKKSGKKDNVYSSCFFFTPTAVCTRRKKYSRFYTLCSCIHWIYCRRLLPCVVLKRRKDCRRFHTLCCLRTWNRLQTFLYLLLIVHMEKTSGQFQLCVMWV